MAAILNNEIRLTLTANICNDDQIPCLTMRIIRGKSNRKFSKTKCNPDFPVRIRLKETIPPIN